MKQKYSIGLDLGTNSIGWAVIDGDFSLVKKGGKNLWGVLLFSEGNSAKDRRTKRTARRRLERRKERIKLLQSLLSKEIYRIDEGFFFRLENSFLVSDKVDLRSVRSFQYNLFDGEFNDKEYYKKYPTIYHLRSVLCNSEEKFDIRLVYLALHHIIKYRGNFLHDEENLTPSKNGVVQKLKSVIEQYADLIEKYSATNNFDAKKIISIITEKNKTASDKAKVVKKECSNDAFSEFIGKALCGLVASPKKAFRTNEETFDNAKDIQFSKESLDAVMDENCEVLGEDITEFIKDLYAVYLEKIFVDILGEGNSSISDAMIKKYEKHKQDLIDLKELLKDDRALYCQMFVSRRKKRSSVASYSNYVKTNTKTSYFGDIKVERENFYKFVKDTLDKVKDCELKQKILKEIELKTFMPKINDVDNSAIPYQINKIEIEQIIDRQGRYYPSLKQNKDKIISLLTFRRPYYVGPLKGKFSWIRQEINERVYPWNFDELVDFDSANQKFIENLVEKDDVTDTERLALQSITYQKYIVLNELNNVRYKKQALPVKLKQAIYNELVLNNSRVTIKDIVSLLNRSGLKCTVEDFSGFADEKKLLGTMKTYREFKNILGDSFKEQDIPLYDKAVAYITAFSDVKSKVNMLSKLFGGKYDGQLIKKLAQKNYEGWGKFSYERLTEKYSDSETAKSILDLLYETEENYMAIVYNERYGFRRKFIKEKTTKRLSYEELISDVYASPSVKKVTWQSVKLVNEIRKIMGSEPEYIFVESARKPDEKKKKKDRYETIKELYACIKSDVEYYNTSIQAELDGENNDALKAEKLYLYLVQLGRCAYTETKLDISRLADYEIDHIIPRCFIKDDSFDNKVLVLKEANQRKSSLALSDDVIQGRQKFWRFLLDNKFISKNKFANLNKREWDDSDAMRFINRQLVELNQINKTVIETLKNVCADSDVLPIKSAIISQMRKMHTDFNPQIYGNFFKIRSLNDVHHAKDAYLVGVVGLFTKENFPVWGNEEKAYVIKRVLDNGKLNAKKTNELINKRYGIIIDYLKYGDYSCINSNGEVIDGNTAYNNVLKVMDKNDVSVVVKKDFDGKTEFYNQTLYGPKAVSGKSKLIPFRCVRDKDGNKVPLNTEIYGGYSSSNQAYYVNVEYDNGKKRDEKLVGVTALTAKRQANGDENATINALKEDYKNPVIIGKPIFNNQLICMQGQKVLITAANEVCNATQLFVDVKFHQMLYLIEKDVSVAIRLENFDELAKDFLIHYLEKLQKHYKLFNNIMQKVEAFVEDGFFKLEPKDKAEYIKSMLVITSRGAGRVDVRKDWNGGSSWGRLSGKTIKRNEVEWINQSITGYYVNVIVPNEK